MGDVGVGACEIEQELGLHSLSSGNDRVAVCTARARFSHAWRHHLRDSARRPVRTCRRVDDVALRDHLLGEPALHVCGSSALPPLTNARRIGQTRPCGIPLFLKIGISAYGSRIALSVRIETACPLRLPTRGVGDFATLRTEFAHDVHEQLSLLDGVLDRDVRVRGRRTPMFAQARFRGRAVARPPSPPWPSS